MEEAKRLGTVAYMAPEMLQGEGKYTAKVDVYSFGLLLWEMATKAVPYNKSSTKTIESLVLAGQRLPIPPYVHSTLADLIQECWSSSPSDRPSFGEVLTKLAGVAAALLASDSLTQQVVPDDSISRARSNTYANI